MLLLDEPQIRDLLDPLSCISAVEHAFVAYSAGRAELPQVIHLDIPEQRGEVHIKAGYIHGGPYYALKAASGFPGNPSLGLSTGNGLVIVFDAQTGAPDTILFDNGYITDLRTAAAASAAAKQLARPSIERVAVVGTGIQGRLQVQTLARVRHFRTVRVWGRRPDATSECVRDLVSRGTLPTICDVSAAASVEEAVDGADIVFTVTASRAPLVRGEWLASGALVVAVGADGTHKRELDDAVFQRAARVVADSLAQCRRIGEIHHALDAGVIQESDVTELGTIIAGNAPGRQHPDDIIVCDLTGVGVQDVAAAAVVVERAKHNRVGRPG